MVTTDKVYRNLENGQAYVETDALGGHDPYSASKAACELVIQSYQQSFLAAQGVAVASARAGNVVGGGDWSVDRLVPDAIKAWQQQQSLAIRNPNAVRPWQHVLEPLNGYLCLAQALWQQPALAGSYNLGPHSHEAASVAQVLQMATQHWPHAHVDIAPTDPHAPHEANLLMLNTQKAQQQLGLQPRWNLEQTVARTIGWYRQLHLGANALALCLDDLRLFTTSSEST
jgi:CDP-glucose 4,6-dehydratase